MTTCRDLIDRAGRQLGVLSAGETVSGDDAADLMRHLQDLILELPLMMEGGWRDVRLTSEAPHSACDGERIDRRDQPGAPVILPATPPDFARVQILGGTDEGVFVFVGEKQAWSRVDALSIADESPFGRKDDAGVAALICASAAEEYGVPLGQVVAQRAQRALASFRARFYRPAPGAAEPALLSLAPLGYGRAVEGAD